MIISKNVRELQNTLTTITYNASNVTKEINQLTKYWMDILLLGVECELVVPVCGNVQKIENEYWNTGFKVSLIIISSFFKEGGRGRKRIGNEVFKVYQIINLVSSKNSALIM